MSGKRKLGWGSRIAILYGSFIVFIVAIGAFAAFQSFPLVEKDYYPKELKYQRQIEKTARGKQGMLSAPRYESSTKTVEFRIDRGADIDPISGNILFFRPSDPRLDIIREINVDTNGAQVCDASDLAKGLWKIKIDWSIDTVGYYFEDLLVIE